LFAAQNGSAKAKPLNMPNNWLTAGLDFVPGTKPFGADSGKL
jgi:hypothetical protein